MANMFTFAVITYNHEEYIIECMQSIKYQIEHYGEHNEVHIVVADDCSSDQTVYRVQKWLNENGALFSSITILDASENCGIVQNTLRAIKAVKTSSFLLLAGDDLLTPYDLIERDIGVHDILLSPAISLADGVIMLRELHLYRFGNALVHKEHVKEYLKKELQYHFPISSTGMLFSKELLNSEVIKSVGRYKWLEDIALFSSLIKDWRTCIVLDMTPYVIYRDSVGISKRRNHPKQNRLAEDNELLRNEVFVRNKRFDMPKLNPVRYYLWLKRKVKLLVFHFNPAIQCFVNDLEDRLLEINAYYVTIRRNAEEWLIKNDA